MSCVATAAGSAKPFESRRQLIGIFVFCCGKDRLDCRHSIFGHLRSICSVCLAPEVFYLPKSTLQFKGIAGCFAKELRVNFWLQSFYCVTNCLHNRSMSLELPR